MADQKTKDLTAFYVGRSGEDGTTKAFCHGKLQDFEPVLAEAMSWGVSPFDGVLCMAYDMWMSANHNNWYDEIKELISDPEWRSIPRTITANLTPTQEKTCICFYVVSHSSEDVADAFCHGKPIDLANLLADAMSKKPDFAAIVYTFWCSWVQTISPVSRNKMFERADSSEWMSSFKTVCTAFGRYLSPEEKERKLMWIEKVHKLSSDRDEFFKRGMPGFHYGESDEVKEKYDQKMVENRSKVLPQEKGPAVIDPGGRCYHLEPNIKHFSREAIVKGSRCSDQKHTHTFIIEDEEGREMVLCGECVVEQFDAERREFFDKIKAERKKKGKEPPDEVA